jgi:CheY-like chemotaxis protein
MATILIVEDEAAIRKLAAANLLARGYDVISAASGEEALAQLPTRPIALILLDVRLSGMQGWEFMAHMADNRCLAPDTPVIIMTASAAEAEVQAPGYPNVVKILIKPFSTTALMQAVADALR